MRIGLGGAITAIAMLGLAGAAPAATCTVTPSATEGPFYTPGAPTRARIATPGTTGTPLVLRGVVRDSSCRPVAGAIVDMWQADGKPHIHVKVGAPGGPVVTTQLYLPGSSGNAGDAFFQRPLLIRDLNRSSTPWTGTYPFVVRR